MISKSPSEGEPCNICSREVPKGSLVLRKKENGHIICIPCLVEIAELTIQAPIEFLKKDV